MNVNFTARKVTLKDSFKELAEKKLSKFDRMLGEDTIANVVVSGEKNRETVEITIRHSSMIYRAEDTTDDMYKSLDKVMESLGRQFRKNKSKLEKKFREAKIEDFLPVTDQVVEEDNYNVVKRKHFPIKPQSVEEAILQMNMLGHKFYMFRNQDTDEINVVYVRKNETYGLLTPDVE